MYPCLAGASLPEALVALETHGVPFLALGFRSVLWRVMLIDDQSKHWRQVQDPVDCYRLCFSSLDTLSEIQPRFGTAWCVQLQML